MSAKFQKMFCPSYIMLKIKKLEGNVDPNKVAH